MNGSVKNVCDRELLRQLNELVGNERHGEADLLAHLGEVEARHLYLEEGCSSMYAYCIDVLHFSEGVAGQRIRAARVARRFPILLERLRHGEIHLAGVSVLATHLTEDNHLERLDRARHKTRNAIEEIVADLAPKPDAPSLVRELPEPVPVSAPSAAGSTAIPAAIRSGSCSLRAPHSRAAGPETLQDPVHGRSEALREAARGAGAAPAPDPGRGARRDLRPRAHAAGRRRGAEEVRADLTSGEAQADGASGENLGRWPLAAHPGRGQAGRVRSRRGILRVRRAKRAALRGAGPARVSPPGSLGRVGEPLGQGDRAALSAAHFLRGGARLRSGLHGALPEAAAHVANGYRSRDR